jgi:hypothetical protein
VLTTEACARKKERKTTNPWIMFLSGHAKKAKTIVKRKWKQSQDSSTLI